jgi:hypothetical protein
VDGGVGERWLGAHGSLLIGIYEAAGTVVPKDCTRRNRGVRGFGA